MQHNNFVELDVSLLLFLPHNSLQTNFSNYSHGKKIPVIEETVVIQESLAGKSRQIEVV